MTLTANLRDFFPSVYTAHGALNARQYNYRAEAAGIMRKTDSTWTTGNKILVELRENGTLPWDAVLDSVRTWDSWQANGTEDPEVHLGLLVQNFRNSWRRVRLPRWHGQPIVPILITEKQGLVPFFEQDMNELETTVYAIRGHAGKSHLHEYFAPWIQELLEDGREVRLLYIGDYDDEGFEIEVVLNRTLREWGIPLRTTRIALETHQIGQYGLRLDPLNPKSTISGKYVRGKAELEALDPEDLRRLIREAVEPLTDAETLRERDRVSEEMRAAVRVRIRDLTEDWPEEETA